jgi:outer membrane lipoprotein-sorting protein
VRWAGLAAALVLAASAGASQEVPTPLGILRRAVEAPLRVDYEGTKVVTAVRQEGAETVRVAIWHRHPHAYRMEFLSPRRLAGRMLLDDGLTTWHYEPSLHLAIRGPSLGRSEASQVEPIPENYVARLLGTDQVAGRPAYLLALLPKAEGVTRRFWVDRATGLVLKSEEADAERGVYFTSTFTRITFGPLPPEIFRFHRPAGVRVVEIAGEPRPLVRLSELSRAVGFPTVAAAELPAGFRYRGGGVSRFGGLVAAVLWYSDGATTVSLFQLPSSRMANPPGGETLRVGNTLVRVHTAGYLRVAVWERGGVRFAAVGSVPLAVLRGFVANSDPNPSTEARLVEEVAREIGVTPDRVADLRDRGLSFAQVREALGASRATTQAAPRQNPVPSLLDVVERFQDQLQRLRSPGLR